MNMTQENASTITLFHGTSSVFTNDILANGLFSPYLTDDKEIAEYYAECAVDEHGGEAVILSVVVDQSKDLVKPDYPAYDEPLTFYRDEYASSDSEWHEMLDEGEIPYPSDENDWATSLETVKSVFVANTIPHDRVSISTYFI